MVGMWRARLVEVLTQWSGLSEDPQVWLDDPEQLHEWRIGYRRPQTLLYWGPEAWRAELRHRLGSSGLKTCMKRSSPLRDLQVAIPRIAAWQPLAPLDLSPVSQGLRQQLEIGMAQWVAQWHVVRPEQGLRVWCETLPLGVVPIDEQVVRAAFAVAWQRWQRQIAKIVGRQRDISGPAIHQVRIKGKRVRYLGEWWRAHLTGWEKRQLKLEKRFHREEGQRQDLRALAALMEGVRQSPTGGKGQRLAPLILARQRQGACWIHGYCIGRLEGLNVVVESAIEAIQQAR